MPVSLSVSLPKSISSSGGICDQNSCSIFSSSAGAIIAGIFAAIGFSSSSILNSRIAVLPIRSIALWVSLTPGSCITISLVPCFCIVGSATPNWSILFLIVSNAWSIEVSFIVLISLFVSLYKTLSLDSSASVRAAFSSFTIFFISSLDGLIIISKFSFFISALSPFSSRIFLRCVAILSKVISTALSPSTSKTRCTPP